MRVTRKRPVKSQVYKEEDDEDEDFCDSGSEASLPEQSEESNSEDPGDGDVSEEEFEERRRSSKKSKTPKNPQMKSVKSLFDKASRMYNEITEERPFSMKDLTEKDKLLPAVLDLSESDSDDDSAPKPRQASTVPLFDSPVASTSFQKCAANSSSKNLLDGLTTLSNSSGSEDDESKEVIQNHQPKKLNFEHLNQQVQAIEDAKATFLNYENRGKAKKKRDIDVKDLLALGEEKRQAVIEEVLSSGSENEDWEVVKDAKPNVPKEGIQLSVDFLSNKPKNKALDLEMMMKRKLNRARKEYQMYMHKVHVLCWLAHGNYVNRLLNEQELMAAALSLIPSQNCYPSDRLTIKYLKEISLWYREAMSLNQDKHEDKYRPKAPPLVQGLLKQIRDKTVTTNKNLVLIFVAMMRALGIKCRLVLSFKVISLRPPSSELCSLSLKEKESKKPKGKGETSKHFHKKKISDIPQVDGADDSPKTRKRTQKVAAPKKNGKAIPEKKVVSADQSPTKSYWDSLMEEQGVAALPLRSKRISHREILAKTAQPKTKSEVDSKSNKEAKKAPPSKLSLRSKIKGGDEKKPEEPRPKRPSDPESKPEVPVKKAKCNEKSKESGRNNIDKKKSIHFRDDEKKGKETKTVVKPEVKGKAKVQTIEKKRRVTVDSEKEFRTPKSKQNASKVQPKRKKDRRVFSSDEEDNNANGESRKKGVDSWCEVYVEETGWVSIDVVKAEVQCNKLIYSRASHPVSYIVAWDENCKAKDITRKYVPLYATVTRKLRASPDWWQTAIAPWLPPNDPIQRQEDEQIDRQQLEAPLPTTVGEYKNHPLYVLKRHLLKFEAIYPPDAATLGFVRSEGVYSRYCVYTLCSRETWLKEAKVVKLGEKPYKIVRARPKWDRLSSTIITEWRPLEIFGPWQVEDYVPPAAENGIVPRNAYGNVELYKASMLPKGTVHLHLPSLNKVARKLNIDCAMAMTGFDGHANWAHPVFDGFVVCEEFKDVLIDAWEREQEDSVCRERDKIENRVYGNWKRLIKGLLIKERLRLKYNFKDPETSAAPKKKKKRK